MEEKKLNDEEVVKALDCCAVGRKCRECPYCIKKIDCFLGQRIERDLLDLIHRLQDENEELKSTKHRASWKAKFFKAQAEIERLTEEANQDTVTHIDICTENLYLRKQNAELQKKVENQKTVIVGQTKRIEKEKDENKRLYDEFVRLDDFCATKGCICCVCEKKKACEECAKCGSLATEKCKGFKIDISKYARAIERADKLQKQVDELKKENCDLLYERQTAFMAGHEQAVKDTAKEILQEIFVEKFQAECSISSGCTKEDVENIGTAILTSTHNKIKEMAKRYGV